VGDWFLTQNTIFSTSSIPLESPCFHHEDGFYPATTGLSQSHIVLDSPFIFHFGLDCMLAPQEDRYSYSVLPFSPYKNFRYHLFAYLLLSSISLFPFHTSPAFLTILFDATFLIALSYFFDYDQ
jgi:hypothetical protein